eukprot:1138629-Pelagomonas_calceolata.AAC.10
MQVTINEDPKTRMIRELRAEVAFLRSQLAALHGLDAAALAMPPTGTQASHPPTPLSLPAGSPRLPGLVGPAGDPQPVSPSKVSQATCTLVHSTKECLVECLVVMNVIFRTILIPSAHVPQQGEPC